VKFGGTPSRNKAAVKVRKSKRVMADKKCTGQKENMGKGEKAGGRGG